MTDSNSALSRMLDDLPGLDLAGLLGLPAQETQVITVNNRYARRLLAQFSAALSQHKTVLAVPDILPLGAWIVRQTDELAFAGTTQLPAHALDAFGAQLLWQQVIEQQLEQTGMAGSLLDTVQAARLAADADTLIDEWHIQVADPFLTPDYQQFSLWRKAYRRALAQRDLDDRNMMYSRVCRAFEDGTLEPPFSRLVLVGFSEASPRFANLVSTLQERGVQVYTLVPAAAAGGRLQRIQAPDPDAEWRLAAQWAKQSLDDNPQGRYAIVSARLEADVVLAHRYLQTVGPCNIALGRPMAQWPLARAALAWLHVLAQGHRNNVSYKPQDLGAALLAGACAGKAEAGGRAMIDALWRRDAVRSVGTTDFLRLLDRYAPTLATAWAAALDLVRSQPGQAPSTHWAQAFRQWLQALGFPGDIRIDSTAYQQLEALDDMLARLAAQEAVLGAVSAVQAVHTLRRLLQETPFQPRRDPAARLDVMGFLEAEGGRWDGVWILGLTDEVLPAQPRPNPFIPVAALRKALAPRATPERELQWANALYAALAHTAPDVLLSHAQFEGERMLRPSPCIAQLPLVSLQLPSDLQRPATLEVIDDGRGPPLDQSETVRGGIAVIDTQARNPLWAFVRYRLGAQLMPAYARDADTGTRGRFIHAVAEGVWSQLKDQEGLRSAVAAAALPGILQQATGLACAEHLSDFSPALQELEKNRAIALLQSWLDFELTRAPFAVNGLEQTFHWQHGALRLKLIIDRVDQLSDGRLVVIDYKTGSGALNLRPDWGRERPVNLQLPLYASVLAHDSQHVGALVLAKLNPRDLSLKGLSDGDVGMGKLDDLSDWDMFQGWTWSGVLQHWSDVITELADEFCSGRADNVTQRPQDLAYCTVLPFLRLTGDLPSVDEAAQ
jgi:probable DNA repair protein